jgi:Lrp/AsnC family transcriptional regulator for asnA, asnC and gidA
MSRVSEAPLDEMDLRILEHLEVDGRKSFSDIAADLGVTLSTVSNRVRRLIEDGILVIHGFLDPYQVGFNAPALILVSVDPPRVEEAADGIAKFPEVLSLLMITGDFDLAVEVHCRDSNHLTDLLLNRLQRVGGVRETRTSIQLREIRIKQPSVKMLMPQSA